MTERDDYDPVGIVGPGYVGCCLAAVLVERGFRVYGVDIDADVVDTVTEDTVPSKMNTSVTSSATRSKRVDR